ncbi:MAG TPA: hypothetical protein VHB30_08030 [Solirubrobacteraceae bacterium]|jgi:hypothetical protein|nr:hypothetical protein [Solirubrobacteraceae bacterium]
MKLSLSPRARVTAIVAIAGLCACMVLGIAASSAHPAPSQTTVYDNIPSPQPSNVPSVGFEATSTSEFGGQLQLAGTQRKDPTVTVLMSSWACKSGSWSKDDCVTNPGSTFNHPVTLNVYGVNDDDSPGALIATQTKTFAMPYRPTMDDGTNCSGDKAGEWWDGQSCVNGKAFTIAFKLDGVTLPDDVIVGVAYNTSNHGYAPIGTGTACFGTPQGCPYDSLNVGTAPAPTVGQALPTADDAYLNSTWSGAYCDGSLGTGSFRLDAGCWTGYEPAVQVEASGGRGGNPPSHHHPQPPFGKGHGHPSPFAWLPWFAHP